MAIPQDQAMDLRQLRYFVGIVEAGSMTAAAERLHVAQSALSLHVRRLEERFEVALLVRQPGGVRPTPAGLKFLDHARAILAGVGAAEAEMRSLINVPRGEVTVAIPPGVGRVLNAALLDAARGRLSGVSLHIVEALPDVVPEWLAEGSADLGIIYELDARETARNLLAREEMYLVSAIERPESEDGITLLDLAQIPLVMPICTRDPKHCIATYAGDRGVRLRIDHRVDSLATILDLVVNHGKAAVLTPGAFLDEWRAGRLFAHPFLPALRRSVLLRAARSDCGDVAVRAVEQLVIELSRGLLASRAWPQHIERRSRSAA